MNINSLVRAQKEVKKTLWKYLYYFRKYINHHKAVGGNMNIKGAAGIEDSRSK